MGEGKFNALPLSAFCLPIDARDVAGRCLVWLLSDECWQDFGYPKRPIRGRLARLFLARQFEGQETFLRRELLSLITAAYFSAGCLPDEERHEVIALYAADPMIYQTLGFAVPSSAVRSLEDSISEYLAVPVDQWRAVLLGRGRVSAALGTRFQSRFERGCLQIGERMVTIVGRLALLARSRTI